MIDFWIPDNHRSRGEATVSKRAPSSLRSTFLSSDTSGKADYRLQKHFFSAADICLLWMPASHFIVSLESTDCPSVHSGSDYIVSTNLEVLLFTLSLFSLLIQGALISIVDRCTLLKHVSCHLEVMRRRRLTHFRQGWLTPSIWSLLVSRPVTDMRSTEHWRALKFSGHLRADICSLGKEANNCTTFSCDIPCKLMKRPHVRLPDDVSYPARVYSEFPYMLFSGMCVG